MRDWLIIPCLALLILPAVPAAAQTRTQMIAGWRISSGGSGDGGYVAGLSRRARGWRLEHNVEYWRGNGGAVISTGFRRGACSSGDASAIVPIEQGLSRAMFDSRLADYLRECPLPPAQARELRRSLDRAWPRFATRAAEALAAMEAELEAIARHGEQP